VYKYFYYYYYYYYRSLHCYVSGNDISYAG